MYAYTAYIAVPHSVCVVFSSALPAFSLSTTRQHMHIRRLLLCWKSISIAIINISIAALHIESLSEMPALQVAQLITSTNTPLSDKSPLASECFSVDSF